MQLAIFTTSMNLDHVRLLHEQLRIQAALGPSRIERPVLHPLLDYPGKPRLATINAH